MGLTTNTWDRWIIIIIISNHWQFLFIYINSMVGEQWCADTLNTADLQKSVKETCVWGDRLWKSTSVRNYVMHFLPFVNMHQL